jgi:Protein of unknown function (DUF2480)
MDEIVNRVKDSGLISIDLASYKPKTPIMEIDIADQLWQRLVLKEKDFRLWISDHNWTSYKDHAVYVHCSEDAIVPTWAYMLIGSKLQENAACFVIGDKTDLDKRLIQLEIAKDDTSRYIDGRIIIKGCSDISCPEFAMVELVKHLQPVAKSIMYGEPCSTVPVFKRK